MKVVFIRCATESLGIEHLSAALKERGHSTALVYEPLLFSSFRLDTGGGEAASARRAARKAMSMNPGLVAFSAESDYYGWALEAAAEVKRLGGVPTVFGGIHVTVSPEAALERPEIDFVCVGEGERALPALCAALESGAGIEGIQNIWGRSGGGLLKNPVGLIADLDTLPQPDKDLFYSEYPGFIEDSYSIVTGRGCPNACSYCHNNAVRRRYAALGVAGKYERRRSPASVVAELSAAKTRYGFRRVSFCDDLFISDKAWLADFAGRYRAEVALPFFCNVHPAHVDEATARLLKEAGCSAATIGIQTVSETLRREVLGRTESGEDARRALRLLAGAGVFVYTNFIFGLPGQDDRELEAVARFAAENPAGFHDVNWLRYYPGTRIADKAQQAGLLDAAGRAAVEAGTERRLYAHGGHSYTPERARLRNLTLLAALLGRRLTLALLDSGNWRRLPAFNLRVPAIITATQRARLFGGNKSPYPNLSLAGSLRYFLRYLLRGCARSLGRGAALAVKAPLNAAARYFFLARLLTFGAALRYARYLLRTRLLGERIPGTAMIALTFGCQCSCACCSSEGFRGRYGGAVMDFGAAERRLKEVIKLGVPRVHFTGGEASLFPRLPELVKLCAGAGITVFVETNGLAVDGAAVDALKAAGLSSLNISLDSDLDEEHDALRKVPGCRAAAITAMRLCAERGQACMASAYATRASIAGGRLARLIRSARRAGAGAVRVLAPVASGGWAADLDRVELAPEDHGGVELAAPLFYPVLNRTALVECALPDAYKIFILPDGALAPCEHLPYVFAGSAKAGLEETLDRMKDMPLFKERTACWPRNREFRARHFTGAPGAITEI